jgi:hypothetical protein
MTELSPAAQAVLDAFNKRDSRIHYDATKDSSYLVIQKMLRYALVGSLRAVVKQLGYSNVPEEFAHLHPLVIDSDELLAIAAELEQLND